jgi:hypothetical protein
MFLHNLLNVLVQIADRMRPLSKAYQVVSQWSSGVCLPAHSVHLSNTLNEFRWNLMSDGCHNSCSIDTFIYTIFNVMCSKFFVWNSRLFVAVHSSCTKTHMFTLNSGVGASRKGGGQFSLAGMLLTNRPHSTSGHTSNSVHLHSNFVIFDMRGLRVASVASLDF